MKNDDLILSSAIKGVLLNQGQPLAGMTIQRELHWNLEQMPRIDSTVTDHNGAYAFAEQKAQSKLGFFASLFHRPEVIQTLKLIQGEQFVVIFSGIRTHYLPPSGIEADCVEISSDLKYAIEVDPNLYAVKSAVKEYLAA